MRREKIRLLILPLLLLLLLPGITEAAMTARSIGLGDDFAVLGGFEALYGNPAAVNLDGHKFVLDLSGTGEFWNNILRNDYISEKDKEKLVSIAERNGLILGLRPILV